MDAINAWLLITRTKGLGIQKIKQLLSYYTCIENVFSERSFPAHLKLSQSIVNALINPDLKSIEHDLNWLEKANNHILSFDDALYPPLLKKTDSPPPLLFITGNPECLLTPQLAVVGSRNASTVGLKNTRSFCYSLAKGGLTITSGMALGVDGMAHKAAIDAQGQTVAVMGTGLDSVYPSKHKELAHEIAKNGALVSEFHTNTKPHSYNFPRRNRIICGLSLGTLVMEASIKSGTLITARQTMEINRPVMAIPGSIHSPMARGCHFLIKQGAKLVESADEIVEELAPLAQSLSLQLKETLKTLGEKTDKSTKTEEKFDNEHLLVLENIQYEATPLEEIIRKSGLTAQDIASILLILELEDKINTLPGACYVRV